MYALKSPQHQPKQTRRARRVPKSNPRSRKKPYGEIAVEATIKLSVNVLLSVVAVAALTKLLSYKVTQEAKMQELNVAVSSATDRVHRVESNFRQYFDASQAKILMQQQTNRIDPSQRQIIWHLPGKNEQVSR